VGHVDRMRAMRNEYTIFIGNLKESDCLEELRVNWKTVLKLISGI
jgi:hypothetical protein